MTLEEIKHLPDAMLTPAQVAPIIGSDPQTLRMWARQRPDLLGFPAVCIGNRVKIPRVPFLRFMGVIGV